MKKTLVKVALLSTFVSVTQINAMQPIQFLPWVKKTNKSDVRLPYFMPIKIIPTKPIVYVNGGSSISSDVSSHCKNDGTISAGYNVEGGGYVCGRKKDPTEGRVWGLIRP